MPLKTCSMFKKPTIGIDLDSTLNNLEEEWILHTYNEEYGDNLKEEDMHCWEVERYAKKAKPEDIYSILLRPHFFYNLRPKDCAREVTEKLSKDHELFIVTAYSPTTVVDKVDWVKKYFPHINPKNIIFCNSKGLIKTDYLIDDGGHNILDYHNNGGKNPIVFDRPWNRHLPNTFKRATGWLQVERMIKGETV